MLRDMAASCIAGDGAAYLRHVASGDQEFRNEQKYFANDLTKKHAAECAFTLADLRESEASATGELTIEWTMPEGRGRKVSFDARFLKEDGQWKFAGETWAMHEAPGVMVLHDPGLDELAERVVTAFGDVRAHVEDGFSLADKELPKKTQKIKLYGTMKHLQASISLSYVDGLSGWNEPGESIKILSSPRTGVNQLRPLLAHEYGHVATFELGAQSNSMPWWVLEGVAELSSEKWARKPDGLVKAWAEKGRLAPWEEITDFETVKGKWRGHVYTQGHHMLGFISDKWEREGRVAWLSAMALGQTIDEASKSALGVSFAQLDAQWRASLPAQKPEEPAATGDEKPDGKADPKMEPKSEPQPVMPPK